MAPCQRQKQTSNVFTGIPEVRKLGLVLWANQSVTRPHPPGRVSRERREGRGGQGKAWIHAVCETRGPGSIAGWTALSEGSDSKGGSVTSEGSCGQTDGRHRALQPWGAPLRSYSKHQGRERCRQPFPEEHGAGEGVSITPRRETQTRPAGASSLLRAAPEADSGHYSRRR